MPQDASPARCPFEDAAFEDAAFGADAALEDAAERPRESAETQGMPLRFTGEIWHWRGPSPYHFVTVPEAQSHHLKAMSAAVTYGWGMIPVRARIGATTWQTSLFAKNGLYVVPVKDAVRRAEQIHIGDTVTIRLGVASSRRPRR